MLNPNLIPEENIKRIYDKPEWVSYVDDRLRYREYQLPDNSEESVDQLVEWYENKRSKRVKYAGQKLKKMFLTLPPVEQRKVGMALLRGNKANQEWVCMRLDNHKLTHKSDWVINWHPCYAELVEEYWNKCHTRACGKLIIQFLDEEVVRKYLDELSGEEYYFQLCRRFVDRPWFKLDVEKLKSCTHINAYLSVMAKTKEGISKEEARRLLYQWIAIVLVSLYDEERQCKIIKDEVFLKPNTGKRRIVNIWGFDTALYYLLCMNLNDVVDDILQWEKKVYHNYFIKCSEFSDFENNDHEWLFREAAVESFPDDMRFLLRINKKHFMYMESIGSPFTVPRLWPYLTISEQEDYEMYLKPSDRQTNKYKTQETRAEELNKLIDKNPTLERLMGLLELHNSEPTVSPVSDLPWDNQPVEDSPF